MIEALENGSRRDSAVSGGGKRTVFDSELLQETLKESMQKLFCLNPHVPPLNRSRRTQKWNYSFAIGSVALDHLAKALVPAKAVSPGSHKRGWQVLGRVRERDDDGALAGEVEMGSNAR